MDECIWVKYDTNGNRQKCEQDGGNCVLCLQGMKIEALNTLCYYKSLEQKE